MPTLPACATRFLASASLAAALACGGGSPPGPAAKALSYTNPTDPTQWRLVQNGTSTPTHLVLDLLAPTGGTGMGVTLVLTVDGSRASWGDAGQGSPVRPGGYQAPLAQRASVADSALRILLSQMNPTPPMTYGTAPVLAVALDLAPGARIGSVALAAAQGGHLGAPLAMPAAVTVQTGTLNAQ